MEGGAPKLLHDPSDVFVPQDEVDGQNPVLRDHPQLQEEVKGWLKDQKVQEIFMQGEFCSVATARYLIRVTRSVNLVLLPGPYSLNGYRVRVYRQDSATQWFTGIITHHDLFSRNMVVMNDQVGKPPLTKDRFVFVHDSRTRPFKPVLPNRLCEPTGPDFSSSVSSLSTETFKHLGGLI